MKAVFIGLGSIGQRHLQNLQALYPDIELYTLRHGRSKTVLLDGNAFEHELGLSDYYNITQLSTIEELYQVKPHIAFVCNPSSLHSETAIMLANLNCHLFIEKPMANNYQECVKLEKIVRSNKLITQIGFQTRFHPIIKKALQLIQSGELGRPLSSSFTWHTYLPHFHPWEDYKKGYAAQTDLGGGVVYSLSHEFDLLFHFHGLPQTVYATKGGVSNLDIDAEETVNCIFNFSDPDFSTTVALSYANPIAQRVITFLFSKASLHCDLMTHSINVLYNDGRDENETLTIERNELSNLILKDFIMAVKEKGSSLISMNEGIGSVKIIDAIHKSLNSNTVEEIL